MYLVYTFTAIIIALLIYSHIRMELKINYLFAFLNNKSCGENASSLIKRNIGYVKEENRYIASLTSMESRLEVVHKAVKSILDQDSPPDAVHLYLSQNISRSDLPETLLSLEQYGVHIRFVEEIYSYKKLIFALKENPDRKIITFDDDLIYPPQVASCLLRYSQRFPGCVVANWARRMRFLGTSPLPIRMGRLLTPPRLEHNIEQNIHETTPDFRTYAYGASGVLYCPGAFDERVFDLDLMRRLCPTEDDLWFKAMAILNGTKTVETNLGINPQHHCILGSQLFALRHINHDRKENGAQLKNVFRELDLYRKIKKMEKA